MLCHIDRVFRRCYGNYCWVDIALCCSVRIVQCQDRITRISNFYALTVSRRFHGPIFRTVLFEYLLNSPNQSAKPIDLKMLFFFLLDILYFECAHRHGGNSIFAGKSALKCV